MTEETGKTNADSSFRLQSTYYHFFKNSSTAMAIADKWGIIVESNDSFTELINFLSGNPISNKNNTSRLDSTFDFLPIHDAIRFSNLLSKLADDDAGSMDFKTPYRDKNNAIHWFKIHAWKMKMDPRIDLSGRGNFIGFIMNDETVEVEAEEKLHDEMRIAEKAMEAKSSFLATMSHEIRTPIQTIMGMTELLEDTSLNREQNEYTQQIKFSADVLLSLVNDILDYSKIEAGKMDVEKIPYCPAETIEQSVKMLSQEMEKKGIKLILQLEAAARRSIIGDPGKFRQVLINLTKNAIKFTPEGSITIGASVALGDEHIRTITISVADTGIGIPKEAREKLFTTFMQADSSHTRRFGGTGLGLAISRSMVELMKGTIEMIPNPGSGSIFRFTIPAEEADPDAVIEEATENNIQIQGNIQDGSTETNTETSLADLIVPAEKQKTNTAAEFLFSEKVMIVEDHPVNRQLFVLIMEKLGIQTVQAEDGQDALEKADSSLDLVFMDIQMPRMNGYEAAAELRKRGFTKPLIAVTASVLAEEKKLCYDAGFDDILPKPFKKPDIEATIRKWTYPELAGQSTKNNLSSGIIANLSPVPAEYAADTTKNAQVFNREELLDTFMNNAESAKTLLSHYLERSAEQLKNLPVLTKEKNWEEAHRSAHSIKGSARTLSGMELGNAAAVMETAYKQVDINIIESSMPVLYEAFKRFKNAAEEFLQA
ncbi:MAG: ATP-binding protein [Treponema sp.]|nr:ATP-binding protein [Treponema sp.]